VMVVLDTLNRSLRGSESSDQDMSAYIRAADAIRDAFNCAVVVVHHCGINGTRPRGHTSLQGACDAQLAVTRDSNENIIVTVEEMKDGPHGDVVASRLDVVDVGVDEDSGRSRVASSCRQRSRYCPSTRPANGRAGWLFHEAAVNALLEHGRDHRLWRRPSGESLLGCRREDRVHNGGGTAQRRNASRSRALKPLGTLILSAPRIPTDRISYG
jgi:hypothetical protein